MLLPKTSLLAQAGYSEGSTSTAWLGSSEVVTRLHCFNV